MDKQVHSKGLILLYHRVADLAHDPFRLAISPKIFGEQMKALADHWPVLSISQGWQRVLQGQPGNWVALSFDDAYRDVLEQAWPRLQPGQAATLFACTHRPELEFWWDRLQDIGLQPKLRRSVRPQLYQPNTGLAPRLDREQLAWLAQQSNCEIGNHTHRHLCLPLLDSQAQLREIRLGQQLLQRWTGQLVRGLAYPFGDQNPALRQQASRCADWSCGVEPGVVWHPSQVHNLPRLWVEPLLGKEFLQWLNGHGLT